jgi:iron complex outermembrane recepter protein
MKLLLSTVMLCIVVNCFAQKEFNDTSFLQPVEITTVKATDKNPFAKTNLNKEEIKKLNIGQDLPFILNNTASVVVNSDAGNGIGYTGIRIRGTDATRINITLNGIPYNDAESLGAFLVNIPDIASSAGNIQIQRGVGTSANGAGSFGGSINLSTNELNKERKVELNSTAGSYGSFKNTLLFNSGLLKKRFLIDARLSNIRSDGYVDRAASRLKSFFISTAFVTDKSSLRLNVFTGKEKTYQAYYGVSEIGLDTNRTYNSAGTEKPGAPYENQTDNYTQTHYQLFYNHKINAHLKSNIALFLTRGKGYYEQYKASQKLTDYGLSTIGVISNSDLARQLWLDNYFYGSIFSLQYDKNKTQLIVGGGYNRYEGNHFGKVIWTKEQILVPANFKYYNNNARKYDFSIYTKWTQNLHKNVQTFVDLQVRNVNYTINGFRNNPTINVNNNFFFFNPKAGITFSKNNYRLYTSYGRAVKEPNRDDFEATITQQPKPEKLNDIETGIEYKKNKVQAGVNFYYMLYKDQLVLNGKINDVGAATRINVANSYRAGMELFGTIEFNKILSLSANLTLSKNKVKNYTDYIYDYDNNIQIPTFYKEADLSYSPRIISSILLNIAPFKNALIGITGKYVGKQFLDNTSNKNKQLRDFYTQDIRASYSIKGKQFREVNFFVQANNVFSKMYEPNGYTFSYISAGVQTTENFYFPMAPLNFVVGINITPSLLSKK